MAILIDYCSLENKEKLLTPYDGEVLLLLFPLPLPYKEGYYVLLTGVASLSSATSVEDGPISYPPPKVELKSL